MKSTIKDKVCGEERAFYGAESVHFINCRIEGAEDGESAFKECRDIRLTDCCMSLRYPLWHVTGGMLENCSMSAGCRAPLWYCRDMDIRRTSISGVKALRECDNVVVSESDIKSVEFGWKTRGFTARDCNIEGEYLFLDSETLELDNISLKGKYSFQYVKNTVIRNSVLDTKDAFWHSENVTVYDSDVKGEYPGWYSKGLRLVRCRISGTQPFCYASDLVLEDCTMTGCDLSFERSEVHATVNGEIHSIKNPISGEIIAEKVGQVISEEGRERITLLTTERPEKKSLLI